MPRPRTKGERIQVQLPLEVDAAVRAKALKAETSPALLVEKIVVAAHRKVAPIDRGADGGLLTTEQQNCTHPKGKLTNHPSGVTRCNCGAVRGVDGTWR